jgi:undecaprenyl pyrophosphate phosphatase UppP
LKTTLTFMYEMEKDVATLTMIIRIIAPLVAAILVGNWFMSEVKKARFKGAPWYQAYVSIPGLLIILVILLPIVLWIIKS